MPTPRAERDNRRVWSSWVGEDQLLQWKPRLVMVATTLALVVAALGGAVSDFVHAGYLDW
jgi:hypothetical protein